MNQNEKLDLGLVDQVDDEEFWNMVPMNYWPLFTFRAELSELRYVDETRTDVIRVRFEDTFNVRAWNQERAVAHVKELCAFRHVTLERLFKVYAEA